MLVLALIVAATGRLEPIVTVDGEPGNCKVSAHSEKHTYDAVSGIDVEEGTYGLRVDCTHQDGALVSFTPNVRVKGGATSSPKVAVTSAKLRVESRRNGVLLPANVKLTVPGSSELLAELPANQTKVVAQGRYDVLVVLKDKASPEAEALFAGSHVGGKKTTILSADLSDGGLITTVTNNGKNAAASIRASKNNQDIGVGETGQEMRLPAGRYTITTELREAADFATVDREVWIQAGKIARLSERFSTGQLTVTVTQDGKPVDANVRLAKPNASDFFNYFPAPGTVSLTPGTYDLTIDSKAAGPLERVLESGIAVRAGGSVERTIDLTPATLRARAVKNGAPAEAKLTVRHAGGGEALVPEADGRWRLWPGNYEIAAELEDGSEVIDGPFPVKLRDKLDRTVRFERALLTVRARRGKTAADDAEISVYRRGAAKPVAKGKSGAKLEVPPGVYDVKVVSGSDVVWQKDVKLKKTQFVDIALPVKGEAKDDLPEGDLAPPTEELPEGDAEG